MNGKAGDRPPCEGGLAGNGQIHCISTCCRNRLAPLLPQELKHFHRPNKPPATAALNAANEAFFPRIRATGPPGRQQNSRGVSKRAVGVAQSDRYGFRITCRLSLRESVATFTERKATLTAAPCTFRPSTCYPGLNHAENSQTFLIMGLAAIALFVENDGMHLSNNCLTLV